MDQSPMQSPSSPTSPVTDFERAFLAARASGDFEPVWARFVTTAFFTDIETPDRGPEAREFRFHVVANPQDGQPCVLVTEELARLNSPDGGKVLKQWGGFLVHMLRPELGLLVVLSDGGFFMPPALLAVIRQRLPPLSPTPNHAPPG